MLIRDGKQHQKAVITQRVYEPEGKSGNKNKYGLIHLDSLDNFKPIMPNAVLVKTKYFSKEFRTKAGLYLVGDPDAGTNNAVNAAEHINRVSEVVRVPDQLYYVDNYKNPRSLGWKTTIQIQPGDIVWHDTIDTATCPIFECGGEEYKLVNYGSMYVAKRGDEVIMLNGNVLFKEVYEAPSETKALKLDAVRNDWKGIVAYKGENIIEYQTPPVGEARRIHTTGFEVGDTVLFRLPVRVLLEGEIHLHFDGNIYRVHQSEFIQAVIN